MEPRRFGLRAKACVQAGFRLTGPLELEIAESEHELGPEVVRLRLKCPIEVPSCLVPVLRPHLLAAGQEVVERRLWFLSRREISLAPGLVGITVRFQAFGSPKMIRSRRWPNGGRAVKCLESLTRVFKNASQDDVQCVTTVIDFSSLTIGKKLRQDRGRSRKDIERRASGPDRLLGRLSQAEATHAGLVKQRFSEQRHESHVIAPGGSLLVAVGQGLLGALEKPSRLIAQVRQSRFIAAPASSRC